jgi:hypothetical protein
LDGAARRRLLDFGQRLITSAPVRRLVFRPEATFWQVLDDTFPGKE